LARLDGYRYAASLNTFCTAPNATPTLLANEMLQLGAPRPPRQLHDVHELFRQSEQTYIYGDLAHMRHLVKQAVAGATFENGTSA
jgi:hypothetical protein